MKAWPCRKCKTVHYKSDGCAPRNVTHGPVATDQADRDVTRNVTPPVQVVGVAPRNVTLAPSDDRNVTQLVNRVAELESRVAILEGFLDDLMDLRDKAAARQQRYRDRRKATILLPERAAIPAPIETATTDGAHAATL